MREIYKKLNESRSRARKLEMYKYRVRKYYTEKIKGGFKNGR